MYRGIDMVDIRKNGQSLPIINIHYERDLCGGNTDIEFTSLYDLSIGNKVSLYLKGILDRDFTISSKNLNKDGTFSYRANDVLKYVREYFIDSIVDVSPSDTNTSLISKIMDKVGVPYNISARNVQVGNLSSIGMQQAIDAIRNLSKMSDIYFYSVGDTLYFRNLSFSDPKYTFNESNTISTLLEEKDSTYRNSVIIWGAYSLWEDRWLHWNFRRRASWQIDQQDYRNVLFSNSSIKYTSDAKRIADSILDIFSNENIVKTISIPGVIDSIDIGDDVYLDYKYIRGTSKVYKKIIDASISDGVVTTFVLDAICPSIIADISNYKSYLYITSDVDGVHRIECLYGGVWEDYNSGLYEKNVRDLKIRRGNKGLVTFSGSGYIRDYSPEWEKLQPEGLQAITGIDINPYGRYIVSKANTLYSGSGPIMYYYVSGTRLYSCSAPPMLQSDIYEYSKYQNSWKKLRNYNGVYIYDLDIDNSKPILSLITFSGAFSGNYYLCPEPYISINSLDFETHNGVIEGIIDDQIRFYSERRLKEWYFDGCEDFDKIIEPKLFTNDYTVYVQFDGNTFLVEEVSQTYNRSTVYAIDPGDIIKKIQTNLDIIDYYIVPPYGYVEVVFPSQICHRGDGAGVLYLGNNRFLIGFFIRTLEEDKSRLDNNLDTYKEAVDYFVLYLVTPTYKDILDTRIFSKSTDFLDNGVWYGRGVCYFNGNNTRGYRADISTYNTINSRGYIGYITPTIKWSSDLPAPINCNADAPLFQSLEIDWNLNVSEVTGVPNYGDLVAPGIGYISDLSKVDAILDGQFVRTFNTYSGNFGLFHIKRGILSVCNELYGDLIYLYDEGMSIFSAKLCNSYHFDYPSGTNFVSFELYKGVEPFVLLTNSGLYRITYSGLYLDKNITIDLNYITSKNFDKHVGFDKRAGLNVYIGGYASLYDGIFIEQDMLNYTSYIEECGRGRYEHLSDGTIIYKRGYPRTSLEKVPLTGYVVADIDDKVYEHSFEKLHVETRRPYKTRIWKVVDEVEDVAISGIYDVRGTLSDNLLYYAALDGIYDHSNILKSGNCQAVEICNYTPVYAIIESGNYHTIYYGDKDITYNYITSGNVTSLRIDDMR